MATIQITPETLRSKASNIRSYRAEHDEIMAKMKNLIYGLNDTWKGEAQQAFLTNYENMLPTFQNFSEMLEGYASLMDVSANEMEAKDQELKAAINSSFV